MRKILILICVLFSYISYSQSAAIDSVLRPGVSTYTFQQTESVNIFYDSYNSKFVIENNTKQIHNFFIGIYDLTGNPIRETKMECLTGKNIELDVYLKPGLYIINVVDKPIVYTKKIVIR